MQNLINKIKNIKIKVDWKALSTIIKRAFSLALKYLKLGIKNLPRLIDLLFRIFKKIFWFFIRLPSRFSYIFSDIKAFFLIRSFWGRTNFYNRYLHVVIIFITIVLFLTGVSTRLVSVVAEDTQALTGFSISNNGNIDTVDQGTSIQSVISRSGLNYGVTDYTTVSSDNLETIASKFGVSKDTIKWANQSKIDYFTESFTTGTQLKIPELNGVLYEVQAGDSLDSVLAKTSGDRFQVIELNQLGPPNYGLPTNGVIFIPNGSLPAPVRPTPTYYYYVNPTVDVSALAGIQFINPMSRCGYSISRGFTGSYLYGLHDGVDFSAAPSCQVVASASGRVYYAGWANGGQGNMVAIDHGSGVYTLYYHASEVIVASGQYVNAGDPIMFVGNTGNAFGFHLHFSMRLGTYNFIDPSPYVPY